MSSPREFSNRHKLGRIPGGPLTTEKLVAVFNGPNRCRSKRRFPPSHFVPHHLRPLAIPRLGKAVARLAKKVTFTGFNLGLRSARDSLRFGLCSPTIAKKSQACAARRATNSATPLGLDEVCIKFSVIGASCGEEILAPDW
jgi:hypothetical protein